MSRVGIIIQARMGSTRLAHKVLEKIENKILLEHIIDRSKACKTVDKVIIAIPTNKKDDVIERLVKKLSVPLFRGSENDVLSRYIEAARKYKVDIIVRVTSDNPLFDIKTIDRMINEFKKEEVDYIFTKNMPIGVSQEVISLSALEKTHKSNIKDRHKEHVTNWILEHENEFKIKLLDPPRKLEHPEMRLTVDTKEDMKLIREIYRRLYVKNKIIDTKDVVDLLNKNPKLLRINQKIIQEKKVYK